MKQRIKYYVISCVIFWIFSVQGEPSGNNKNISASEEVLTTIKPEDVVSDVSPNLDRISIVSRINPDSVTLRLFRSIKAEKVENLKSNDTDGLDNLFYRSLSREISNTTMFLQGTDFSASSSNLFLNGSSTSLLHTAYSAYKNHNNLVFRPDDIWLAILTQFSHYVNKNSEELRHLFVSFSEGKKELWVNYTSITVDIVPFDDMIDQMVALVEENVNANLSSWILPNFSTTTKNDIVTSGSIFLATVQKYFAYNLWLSTCGIPNLTLLGRREDWVEIRMRIDKLRKFEISGETLMNKWASQLSLVLDEFVKVKTTGEVDHEFWEGIVQHGRYWAVCTARDFVDGWITAFTPFNKDGEWIGMHLSYRYKDYCEAKTSVNWSANAGEDGKCPKRDKKCRLHKINQEYNKKLDSPWNTIHIEDFLAVENRVKFPLKIKDDYAVDLKDGVYEGTVHAGYMGHAVDKDEVTLKPIMGWVVALHGKRPGYLNLMKKNKVI